LKGGAGIVATNSILNNVRIKDKQLARNFVKALENAENKKAKEVVIPHTVQKLDKGQIKAVFDKE